MSCTPSARMDLCIYRGNDLRVIVTVRDTAGQLVDISAADEIWWEASPRPGGTPFIQKQLTASDITLGAPPQFFFDIDATESAAFPVGRQHHEALLKTSGGKFYTVLYGKLKVVDATIVEA